MIVCPKCNRQLEDGARFCDGCGEKIIRNVICPNCGKEMGGDVVFCQFCGAKIAGGQTAPVVVPVPTSVSGAAPAPMPVQTAVMPAPVPVPAAQPVGAPAAAAVKKPFPKKAVLFGGIGLAAAAMIIVLIVLFMGKGSALGSNYALYFKNDGELYLNKFSGDPWQVSERFGAPSNSNIAYSIDEISRTVAVSKDGKTIFYPDRMSSATNGITLFYRSIDSEDDGVRIDTSVNTYAVNDSATVVTYIKAGDYNLYQYSLKSDEKNKIDSDVSYFLVSDDGKKIVYCNDEGSIYSYDADSDSKEKIDSGDPYAGIRYVSEDMTTVYYLKDNDLYKKVEGEDKVKIASDVESVYRVYDSGELYYIKNSENSISLMDYVQDDFKDSDALITEPVYPTRESYPNYPSRPYRFQYDSQEEYEAALEEYDEAVENYNKERERISNEYEEAQDKYWEDYDKYWEKVSRDSIREYLKTAALDKSLKTLYYYDGAEEKVINSSFQYYQTSSSDSAVMIFSAYKQDDINAVKLSEITNVYEVSEMVNNALFSETEYRFTAKGESVVLDGAVSSVVLDGAGEHLYYVVPEEDKDYGNLYSASVSDGILQTPEIYDTEVYGSVLYTFSDGKLVYWKDYESYNSKGDLYIDKERIDYDVSSMNLKFNEEAGSITYLTDIDSKDRGTLKVYKDGSSEKVSDDVSDYCVLPGGKILYLYDYNTNRNRGELHMYSSGKTEKVDDDVVAVFKIDDSKYKYCFL